MSPRLLRRFAFLAAVLLALLSGPPVVPARAQDALGQWTALTSMRRVTALSFSDDALWAATTGGVFGYRPATGDLDPITAGDGLTEVSARAIAYDGGREAVWVGYADGVLDRLDARTRAVRSFRDIARSERFNATEINRLVVRGDSVFVATAFGVVIFDPVREEVRDTYSTFGDVASGTPVRDVLVAPVPGGAAGVWVATDDGVVHAALATVNLQDPTVWTVERSGLPSVETRSLAYFGGRLYVGTAAGIAVRQDDGTFQNLGITSTAVGDLAVISDRLLGVDRFGLVNVDASGTARRFTIPGFDTPVSIVEGPSGGAWVGDTEGGLLELSVTDQVEVVQSGIFPNGPFDGLFDDLEVDAEGNLWAGGAQASSELPMTGFYRRSPDGAWTNYTGRFFDALQGRTSFQVVHTDPLGNAWAGSSGGGLAQVTPEGELRVYDETNSSLRPVTGTQVLFVGGVGSDEDGRLWVTSRGTPRPLHTRAPDGTWTGFASIACGDYANVGTTLDELMVDSFGQKWVVVVDLANLRRRVGLLVLDTGPDPLDAADDACQFYNQEGSAGQGLPNVSVNAVAEGRDGLVWIATDDGLAYFINSGIVAHDQSAVPIWPQLANPQPGDSRFLFNGIAVNDVAVDPANRLWVATDEGVSLVQPVESGYEIVQTFTAGNSPLLSNGVIAVTVNDQTGEVFFATDRGLISFLGDAVAAAPKADDLFVYPNPVRIDGDDAPTVFIQGLVEETELRIVAPHGEVVARLATHGGRAQWDGRDRNNQLVPSGVYLVIAVGQNGEGTAYGKVAVIR